jgi:hypothetical protein
MSVTPNADPDVRFLVVRAPASTVESYAYGYTRVIDENPGEGYGPVTTAIVLATFDTAERHAEVQRDRLLSGMYRAEILRSWVDARQRARDLIEGEGF